MAKFANHRAGPGSPGRNLGRTKAQHQLRSLLREFYPTFLAVFTGRFTLGIASPETRWRSWQRLAVSCLESAAVRVA
jgi:hypothetical protein